MISIRNSASYRRDCQIYEKYANFAVGDDRKKFIQLYEQFKQMVKEFDEQSMRLDSSVTVYNTHKDLKTKLIAHKEKMDTMVKSEKYILQQIKKKPR